MKHNRIPAPSKRRERIARYQRSLHPTHGPPTDSPRGRLVALLLSLVLIAGGVHTLLRGGIGYLNYWGGTIFAPLAIVLGFVLGVLVVFRWRTLNRTLTNKDGKPFVFPGSDELWRKW